MSKHAITILLADDDKDDQAMTREAFLECRLYNPMVCVDDGEQLMDYLYNRGAYSDAVRFPLPGLILLDLNMPRMDGREALRTIKADATLRQIPVVVLTTSKAEEDVARCYADGVNSFISKPVSFTALLEVVQTLGRYWLQIVDLPKDSEGPPP